MPSFVLGLGKTEFSDIDYLFLISEIAKNQSLLRFNIIHYLPYGKANKYRRINSRKYRN